MKPIEFHYMVKAGKAVLTAYDKRFYDHRFRYYTGISVPENFNPGRPGAKLSDILEKARLAVRSLEEDGEPISTPTLKHRLGLIISKIAWDGDDLLVWTGKVERVRPASDMPRKQVERLAYAELRKSHPQIARLSGSSDVVGLWRKIIEGKISPKSGGELKKSSISDKQQTLDVFLDFQASRATVYTFDDMNKAFYSEFTLWMRKEKGYDVNTIGKHIKNFKAVLSVGYDHELFEHKRYTTWKVPRKTNEVVIPDKDEFLALVNLPLKGALDDHRDTFVLASFLGPRIGDWKQFDEKNLIVKAGVTYFTYVQEKTGHICSIPVHSLAQKILDKRGGKFPPQISEQNLRYAVKRIWEMVAEKMPSLKHRVVVKVRDNQPVYAIKHTVFSPHTARRIFASQLFYGWFTKPMPASYCMHYTGHKKESSFLRYINAKTKEIAEKALEYFDYPNMKVSG